MLRRMRCLSLSEGFDRPFLTDLRRVWRFMEVTIPVKSLLTVRRPLLLPIAPCQLGVLGVSYAEWLLTLTRSPERWGVFQRLWIKPQK